jgi:hypothetical protein
MIQDWWHDLKCGVRNIVRWGPIIWRDRDWDWAFLAKLMEVKLRQMSACFAQHGHHVNSKRDAKRALLCAILLKRLQDDNYMENAGWDHPTWKQLPEKRRKHIVSHSIKMEQQDQWYLGHMIGKYFRSWWD